MPVTRAAPLRCTATEEVFADDARTLLRLFSSRGSQEVDKEAALQNIMSAEPVRREATLDAALQIIKAASGSRLAACRWPLPLPSRRATLGCFQRLLDDLEAEEPGSGTRSQESDAQVRSRRFLLVLLRQARVSKGVWSLEGEARLRQRQGSSMEEGRKGDLNPCP